MTESEPSGGPSRKELIAAALGWIGGIGLLICLPLSFFVPRSVMAWIVLAPMTLIGTSLAVEFNRVVVSLMSDAKPPKVTRDVVLILLDRALFTLGPLARTAWDTAERAFKLLAWFAAIGAAKAFMSQKGLTKYEWLITALLIAWAIAFTASLLSALAPVVAWANRQDSRLDGWGANVSVLCMFLLLALIQISGTISTFIEQLVADFVNALVE